MVFIAVNFLIQENKSLNMVNYTSHSPQTSTIILDALPAPFLMLRIMEPKVVVRLVSVCGDGGCAPPDLSAVAHVSVRG